MTKEYEVIGACITDVPTNTAGGEMRVTLYKGARISSATVPAKRIAHLLDVRLIKQVDDSEGSDGEGSDGDEDAKKDDPKDPADKADPEGSKASTPEQPPAPAAARSTGKNK